MLTDGRKIKRENSIITIHHKTPTTLSRLNTCRILNHSAAAGGGGGRGGGEERESQWDSMLFLGKICIMQLIPLTDSFYPKPNSSAKRTH